MNPEASGEPLNDVLASLTDVSDDEHRSNFGGTVTALIAQVHAGDRSAEDGLYCAVIDQLVGKARKILRDYGRVREAVEPEELVAEVFQNLRKVLASHDITNRQHFFRIACKNFRWKIGEILRRPRQLPHEDLPEQSAGGTGVSSQAAETELKKLLLGEIDLLDDTQRQLIECRFYLDMTFREIGELLGGIPHTTVKYQIDQALRTLHDRLAS